jgi:hypothetical protein
MPQEVQAIHCPFCSEWTAEQDWKPDPVDGEALVCPFCQVWVPTDMLEGRRATVLETKLSQPQ